MAGLLLIASTSAQTTLILRAHPILFCCGLLPWCKFFLAQSRRAQAADKLLADRDRHGLGVDGRDDRVNLPREEAEQLMLAFDWRALGTTYSAPRSPQSGEGRTGASLLI
jgi:hypothetical protein